MAVTRRIRNLTIHFLGDSAEQLAGMFDDAHHQSKTFRRDMDETSRTHRNIYVGSALADLQDQPDFGNADFNPQSKELRERQAFGKAAGAETRFIVVKPGAYDLLHVGRPFDASAQLALVHELLHPSQMIRELADQGKLGEDNERQTQMREQRVAVELGKMPGKDFPDVIGSGAAYEVRRNDDPQPNSAPSKEPEPFAPIGYHGPALVQPTPPSWREARGSFEFPRYAAAAPAAGLPNNLGPTVRPDAEGDPNTADSKPARYLSSRFAGKPEPFGFGAGAPIAPLVPSHENFDRRQPPVDDRFGSWTGFCRWAARYASARDAATGSAAGRTRQRQADAVLSCAAADIRLSGDGSARR